MSSRVRKSVDYTIATNDALPDATRRLPTSHVCAHACMADVLHAHSTALDSGSCSSHQQLRNDRRRPECSGNIVLARDSDAKVGVKPRGDVDQSLLSLSRQ